MINNNELRDEIYKIINESISEEERNSMNLTLNQIIPTIDLFKRAQRVLIEMYFDDQPRYNWNMGYYYSKKLKNSDINLINISLLQKLCKNSVIEFNFNNDTIELVFSWHYSDIENDIMKKYDYNMDNIMKTYNYNSENIQNVKRQIDERNVDNEDGKMYRMTENPGAPCDVEITEESRKILAKNLFK